MNTFVGVLLLICAGWVDIKGGPFHKCMEDEEINVRISDIIEFKEFDFVECKHISTNIGCGKQPFRGCDLKLNGDRRYISEFSCENYSRN